MNVHESSANFEAFTAFCVAKGKLAAHNAQSPHGLLYLVAACVLVLVWQLFHDIGLSTLLTFSVLIQVMALASLLMTIALRRSAHGVSVRSIDLQALSFALRLCCTTWLKGYLPIDSTGDWLYQLADFTALCLCLQISYACRFRFADTYDEKADSFRSAGLVVICTCFAVVVHPTLNNRPLFDTIWTISLYIDVVSSLPQLHMMARCQGKTVDALSAHYVFFTVLSRCFDAVFWYYGYPELAPTNGGINFAGYCVIGAHLVHLALNGDFVWCYAKQIMAGRVFDAQMDFSIPVELV